MAALQRLYEYVGPASGDIKERNTHTFCWVLYSVDMVLAMLHVAPRWLVYMYYTYDAMA
jgi:hypothetical protein